MKSSWLHSVGPLLAIVAACSSPASSTPAGGAAGAPDSAAVVKSYAALVHANYEATLDQMTTLQKAIDAFVAAPTQAGFDAAKAAWVTARLPYLQSEAFRFAGGPIDSEPNGPEGMINGWPIDESYVDYVIGDAEAGIINKKADFPAITKDVIKDNNEKGGEKNLSAGWHVIEYLLWGQDLKADGTPNDAGTGMRPFTDFVDGGTAKNQDRRRAYLKAATVLMVEQFESVEVQWDLVPGTYATKLVEGDPAVALSSILNGIGSLSGGELANQRMSNAYKTKEQEEEHSCFSDTTNQDLVNNGVGIENVYLGRFGPTTGASISDLVKAKDPALDAKVRADLTAALDATKAIPVPFDNALLGADDSDGRKRIKAAIDGWGVVKSDIVAIATALGVKINLSQD